MRVRVALSIYLCMNLSISTGVVLLVGARGVAACLCVLLCLSLYESIYHHWCGSGCWGLEGACVLFYLLLSISPGVVGDSICEIWTLGSELSCVCLAIYQPTNLSLTVYFFWCKGLSFLSSQIKIVWPSERADGEPRLGLPSSALGA